MRSWKYWMYAPRGAYQRAENVDPAHDPVKFGETLTQPVGELQAGPAKWRTRRPVHEAKATSGRVDSVARPDHCGWTRKLSLWTST